MFLISNLHIIEFIKEAEVWKACEKGDDTNNYVADYHFIEEIQDVQGLAWIYVGNASFGLTNYTGNFPSPMIPPTFERSITEMIMRITQ